MIMANEFLTRKTNVWYDKYDTHLTIRMSKQKRENAGGVIRNRTYTLRLLKLFLLPQFASMFN